MIKTEYDERATVVRTAGNCPADMRVGEISRFIWEWEQMQKMFKKVQWVTKEQLTKEGGKVICLAAKKQSNTNA